MIASFSAPLRALVGLSLLGGVAAADSFDGAPGETFINTQFARPRTPEAAGVYFQRDDARPWQNCYSIPQAEALARVRAGRFNGAGAISILGAEARGERIILHHGDPLAPTVVPFGPCPFSERDRAALLECEVTVQTARGKDNLDTIVHYPEIEAEWRRRDPSAALIDCRRKTALTVRNTWKQSVTLADYLLMKHIAALGRPLVPMSATGVIREGGSLHPGQNWSASVGIDFMSSRLQMEMCDASIEELSVSANRSLWLNARNGSWCPWGLEFVALACPNLPEVRSPTALERLRLPDTPETTAYCAGK